MTDYEKARITMVDNQIRTTDVTSHSVLKAFLTVPREAFVPDAVKPIAYIDNDIEVAPGRYVLAASPLAKLLQLAAVTREDLVLEIGCCTGYTAALLSHLAGGVVTLDSDGDLVAQAQSLLTGYDNVQAVSGDMAAGHRDESPYDIIFISGAVEEVPAGLFDQLRDGGRLIAVVGHGNSAFATLFTKENGGISATPQFNSSIRPLPGFLKAREFVF
ncbi:protein-L-isoaspartate O-methyltransferase family protein [Neorhizobium sp. NPDC001467]|uniref:protein-L-isoaspartate O-methyltransferase family protein n=1 Tax=Neorhizobium sp. NPDC001467 TaxID=3390595 RepID=UPI003D0067A0